MNLNVVGATGLYNTYTYLHCIKLISILILDAILIFSIYFLYIYMCREMFKLPNKTGFEVIIQFLFSCLDPARCHEQFR